MGLVQTVFGADVLEECIAAPKMLAALRTRVLSRHVRRAYVGRDCCTRWTKRPNGTQRNSNGYDFFFER